MSTSEEFSWIFNVITIAGKNDKLENKAINKVKEVNTPKATVLPKLDATKIINPQSKIKLV